MARERIAVAPQAAEAELRRAIVERARRRGFARFVVSEDQPLSAEPGEEVLVRHADGLSGFPGSPRIPIVAIASAEALGRAVAAVPDGSTVAIEWVGDRVIPLENAIAARGRRFRLWAYARTPAEVPGALGALEHGADRVIVELRTPEEVDTLEALVESALPAGLDWQTVAVRAVRPAGVGDRVLVDTTSLLRPSEGLLVGSAAAFLFHVASEAIGSAFSRPRPFRVNAGAAHSYVLLADGTTRYLAELEAGDAVLAVEPAGGARAVRVGRIKIERRPMVVVEAEVDDRPRTVFLQEAETVRLSTDTGRLATTEIRPGARVHGVRLPAARHLGTAVQETIEER
ncbi:MAG TPA: 3-dehydroquinate synthase II [Thermoplasmata archaeon]|nr:3-dehydroquinate synthase II [Thermoplasmata archaeon]